MTCLKEAHFGQTEMAWNGGSGTRNTVENKAYIARSGEWSRSRHIHVMIFHVIHVIYVNSYQFIPFMSIHAIHGNLRHSCQFMPFSLTYLVSFPQIQ
jgi:hypothetical protein